MNTTHPNDALYMDRGTAVLIARNMHEYSDEQLRAAYDVLARGSRDDYIFYQRTRDELFNELIERAVVANE